MQEEFVAFFPMTYSASTAIATKFLRPIWASLGRDSNDLVVMNMDGLKSRKFYANDVGRARIEKIFNNHSEEKKRRKKLVVMGSLNWDIFL